LKAERPDPNRWRALILLCSAFFMVVLDIAIVNVALPSIGKDLKFSQESLQWVVTAYALTFGGLLLLGGRAADLLGRRRVFMVGVAVFTLASLACGLSSSETVLIIARGVQGIGAAIISPAALSIITTTFTEGSERNKALGAWGGVGGGGAAVGVLLGGVLTKYLGWEWIFFVNVPVGAATLALTRSVVRESRRETAERRFDALGAVAVTAGLIILVYAISKAPDVGWATLRTIGLLGLSAVLLLSVLVWETRVREPLMPLSIFRIRLLSAANLVALLQSGTIFSQFFVLTLYMQQVLHYSALQTGVYFLATAGTAIIFSAPAQALTTRLGPKPVLVAGLVLLIAGLAWYTRLPVDGSYGVDLLPGFLAVGIALPFSYIPLSIAALAGVDYHEAGLASGLFNTSQQIGGAIGLAVISTVATTQTNSLLNSGHAARGALTSGFAWALAVAAAIGVASLVAALIFIRGEELEPAAEAVLQSA
jgi:EmrB/QacA subfamily drug resistance transporter